MKRIKTIRLFLAVIPLIFLACNTKHKQKTMYPAVEKGVKYIPHIKGELKLLYRPDSTIGAYINDHTLFKYKDKWHLIGITSKTVPADPMTETYFAHGVGDSIVMEGGYRETDQRLFEETYNAPAWAPYAFSYKGLAYCFYGPQKISLRTSEDGFHWLKEKLLKKIPEKWNPNVKNLPFRDAMIIKIWENGKDKWLMYAASLVNIDKEPYYSGVELLESCDLMHWDSIGFALTSSKGVPYYNQDGGFESPFVMKYGDYYYLSVTYVGNNDTVPYPDTYSNTIIFRSLKPNDPYHFGNYSGNDSMIIARLPVHAPEYVVDPETGKWYITACGWAGYDIPIPGAVAIAELGWEKEPENTNFTTSHK